MDSILRGFCSQNDSLILPPPPARPIPGPGSERCTSPGAKAEHPWCCSASFLHHLTPFHRTPSTCILLTSVSPELSSLISKQLSALQRNAFEVHWVGNKAQHFTALVRSFWPRHGSRALDLSGPRSVLVTLSHSLAQKVKDVRKRIAR